MNLHKISKLDFLKKYLQLISLGFFINSCEMMGDRMAYENSRTNSPARREQYRQYPAQAPAYNPYNNPYPASRRYYDPYQFKKTPSPYGGQNPYYDYDQYYVPPSQYYNNEEQPGLTNSINSNKS